MASTCEEDPGEMSSRASRSHVYASALPPVALRYLMIRSTVEVLTTGTLLCGLVLWLVPGSWSAPSIAVMAILIAAGLIVDVPIVSRLTMRHTSYAVDTDAVRVKRGFLLSKDTVLSTAQILNVAIIEGPLLRRFGLAKVRFTTLNHVEPLGPVERGVAEEIRREALSIYLEASTDGN
ncbi:PH domain-containing protein [Paenarthrobacter sp. NPDC056912]|uniref:PH domain-containing protein n=1 Tax=Paenarthrobacter sp. NPDC056912 TaxID=3345965 RepID=UPI00366AD2A6